MRLYEAFITGNIMGHGDVTEVRRVMVVHTESVFGKGVVKLLTDRADLVLIGYDPVDQADLLQTLRQVEPDVVIFTRGEKDLSYAACLQMAERSIPRLRVIVLGHDEPLVYVLDKQQMSVSTLYDLFALLNAE
jgi:hypothetical protein